VVVCWFVIATFVAIPTHARVENDIGDEAEKTLIELNERVLEEYILNNNVEPLRGTAVEEFFVVTPVGIESRQQVMETVGNLDVDSIRIDLSEIHVYGSTAVLAGTVIADGQLGGRPMPPITYLSVYAKEGDRWRLVARSLTPILAPPPR
jgi:hypothetical protein